MTKDEEIIYANACGIIDDYTGRMKRMIEKAFENKAIETEGRNPMYIGLAYDVACAAIRWAVLDLRFHLDNKENVIQLSEKMERNFRTPEQEKEFFEKVLNTKF